MMQSREQILDILKVHGCKATFFAIGENLDNDAPDRPLFKRMCEEGMFEKHQYVTS